MLASNWQPTAHLRYAAVSGQMQQLWERECRETREYNGRPRLCTWTEQQWHDIPYEQPSQETSVPHPPFGECTAVVNGGSQLCTNAAEPGTHRCKQHSLNR